MPEFRAGVQQPSELHFYLGCVPVQGPHKAAARSLESALEKVLEQVCHDAQVADWRVLKYGEGKGLLAAALTQHELDGVILVSRSSDLWPMVLELFGPKATSITVGGGL